CMTRRLMGVWRMDVPMSATASRAASTSASSCVVRGNCQARSPKTSSQPMPWSALTVSGGSSRGAKIRIFGLDIDVPRLDGWDGRLRRGEPEAGGDQLRLIPILEPLPPPVQLFAHESLEFLRRAAHRADPGFLEFVGDDR